MLKNRCPSRNATNNGAIENYLFVSFQMLALETKRFIYKQKRNRRARWFAFLSFSLSLSWWRHTRSPIIIICVHVLEKEKETRRKKHESDTHIHLLFCLKTENTIIKNHLLLILKNSWEISIWSFLITWGKAGILQKNIHQKRLLSYIQVKKTFIST